MRGDSRNGSSRSSESGSGSGESFSGAVDTLSGDFAVSTVAKEKPKSFSDKTERLIDWNVDVLLRLIQQIVARRDVTIEAAFDETIQKEAKNPFDEVKEIISLPEFKETRKQRDPSDTTIPVTVSEQLREYVSTIAGLYNENPFHNFEHVRTIVKDV
jgi:hypothetical protein